MRKPSILIFLLCAHLVSNAQHKILYRIETDDGNEYIGRIVIQDAEKIGVED